jgi:hypothetical protein
MASCRALVLTAGGRTQEAKDADTILVSSTILNGSGSLTINAAATAVNLQAAGTTYLTVSSLGVTALNGAAFTGPGTGLTGLSGSNFANESANTFLAGPTSGAAAQPTFRAITNADLPATAPTTGGLTLTGTPVAGQLMYPTTSNNTMALAKADATSTSPSTLSYYDGTASTVTDLVDGIPASVFFPPGLNGGATGAPAAGQDVCLSDSTAGDATNNAPTTSGHVVLYLGTIKDATGYDNVAGARLAIWPRVGQPIARA